MPVVFTTPFRSPTSKQLTLSLGPIAFWRLGESVGPTVIDETGNHDGSYGPGSNEPTLGQPSLLLSDPSNTSANFDKSNQQFASIPDHVDLRPQNTDYSVSLWFNTLDVANWGSLYAKRRNAAPSPQWAIYQGQELGGAASKKLIVEVLQDGSNFRIYNTTNDVIDGNTHHLAVTWEISTNTITIYVDGSAVPITDHSSFGTVTNINNNDPVLLGHNQGPAVAYFNGTLDEVSVYKYKLSATNVQTLYNVGVGAF